MAALAYVLTWLTGLIVFLAVDEDETFARWHAVQATGLGLVFYLFSAVLGVVAAVLALLVGFDIVQFQPGFPAPVWLGVGGVLGGLLPLVLLVLVVVLAVKAYDGQTPRLPVIARFADDLA